MHTKNSVVPKLKVDNLVHLSDHGMSVVFTHRKLASLVDSLKSSEGKTELSAGKSSLEITRLGNVTMTRLHLATSGSGYWHETMHYLDERAELSFKVKRQEKGFEEAFDTLRGVIFGEHKTVYSLKTQILPPIWFPHFGSEADKLRTWLTSYAWTLTGAHGMRAQAEKAYSARLGEKVRSIKNGLSYLEQERERLDETPESFRAAHEFARTTCQSALVDSDRFIEECERDLREVSQGTAESARVIARQYGAREFRGTWDSTLGNYGAVSFGFEAVPAAWSHSPRSANYVATIGPDGETVSLSSGIACSLKRSEIVAWLKGEKSAPKTNYGTVEKFESATHEGTAVVFLRCGCHYIDAGKIDAELAQLLTPKHTVARNDGKPKVLIGDDGFLARLAETIANRSELAKEQRESALRRFAEKRHVLTDRQTNLPARIAEQDARIEQAKGELATAELAVTNAPKFTGATCAENKAIAQAIINSQNLNLSLS
jgi:hypothetical protein